MRVLNCLIQPNDDASLKAPAFHIIKCRTQGGFYWLYNVASWEDAVAYWTLLLLVGVSLFPFWPYLKKKKKGTNILAERCLLPHVWP